MHCVSFVDVDGKTGEFRAGTNHRQAKALADAVLVTKGQSLSQKAEQTMKEIGLRAPIAKYRIVKRPGKFKKVGMTVPETASEKLTREEPVRLVRHRKLSEEQLLVANA